MKKFQEISDAYTLLTERQLSGSGAAATATVTVVTAPGKWHELAAALDDVALNSDRSALLVDGSGDARVFLEQISRAPIMPVESGGSIKRDLFGEEMRNIAKSQLTDSSFFLGTLVDSMAAGKPFVVDLSQPQQNTKVDLSGNVLLAKLRFLLDGAPQPRPVLCPPVWAALLFVRPRRAHCMVALCRFARGPQSHPPKAAVVRAGGY